MKVRYCMMQSVKYRMLSDFDLVLPTFSTNYNPIFAVHTRPNVAQIQVESTKAISMGYIAHYSTNITHCILLYIQIVLLWFKVIWNNIQADLPFWTSPCVSDITFGKSQILNHWVDPSTERRHSSKPSSLTEFCSKTCAL